MEIVQIAVMGLIQGFTEFLPVSSSGHLVIFKSIFGLESPGVAIEVILHLGTLAAVLIYFFEDIKKIIQNFFRGIFKIFQKKQNVDKEYFRLSLFIIFGTIPAAFTGLFFKDFLEKFFNNVKFVYIFLNITGLILLSTIYKGKKGELNAVKSFLIGIAQAAAILPGVSRSGITISTGLWLNINKELAAKFSFFLSVPSILGAVVLSFPDFKFLSINAVIGLIVGFIISLVSGYFAIKILLNLVFKNKFFIFGLYCLLIGIIGLIIA